MPKTILTHLRKKLKTLFEKFLDIPRFWGPLITILCTIAYHATIVVYFGLSPAVMPLTVFLVLGASVAGLRAGLLCAAWIGLYALYTIPDLERVIQIIAGSVAIAAIVGYESRIARRLHKAFDELFNGNVQKAHAALNASRVLLNKWNELQDTEKKEYVQEFNHFLAHLLTGVMGYRQMRLEQQAVEQWFADSTNVRRAQVFTELKERTGHPVAYLAMTLSGISPLDLTLVVREVARSANGPAIIQALRQAIRLVENEQGDNRISP